MFSKVSQHAQNAESLLKSVFYLSLFSGFLILTCYSAEIDYFPVNSFNSGVYFLLLMALIGFIFFICIIAPLALNYYFWLMPLQEREMWIFLFKEEDKYENYFKSYKEGKLNLSRKDTKKLIRVYLGYLYLSSTLWIGCFWISDALYTYFWLMFFFIILVTLFIATEADKKNKWACPLYLLALSLISSFMLIIIFFLATRFCKWNSYQFIIFFISFITCSGLFLIFLIPAKKEISIKVRIISAAVVTFLLLMLTVGPGNFSYNVLQKYVIGARQDVNILVTQDECIFLNKRSKTPICHQENNLYIVDDIIMLWRAGEYFIRSIKNKDENFILPYKGGRNISFGKKEEVNKD